MEQVKIANITQKTIRPADKTGYIEVKFRNGSASFRELYRRMETKVQESHGKSGEYG